MKDNPYQPPKANLLLKSEFKRSIWWKIYFFFIIMFSILGYSFLFSDENSGLPELVDIAIWVIAIVGFFGFVFLKPIYKPKFWLIVLITNLIYSASYFFITNIDLRYGMSEADFYLNNAISYILVLPVLYGLFSYSRTTNSIWKNNK